MMSGLGLKLGTFFFIKGLFLNERVFDVEL